MQHTSCESGFLLTSCCIYVKPLSFLSRCPRCFMFPISPLLCSPPVYYPSSSPRVDVLCFSHLLLSLLGHPLQVHMTQDLIGFHPNLVLSFCFLASSGNRVCTGTFPSVCLTDPGLAEILSVFAALTVWWFGFDPCSANKPACLDYISLLTTWSQQPHKQSFICKCNLKVFPFKIYIWYFSPEPSVNLKTCLFLFLC